MKAADRYDVAIVGASTAGCTAARLFGEAGARVALIERRSDPAAYKVACTHAILSSATPTIERLGLGPLLEARGVVRTGAEFWTPHGGWLRMLDAPKGYGITRRTLDPLLRELAASTPGVELLPGLCATGLMGDNGRPAGVEVEDSGRRTRAIRARLLVAADGRDSTVARLSRVPGRVLRHNRAFYFAYFRGVRPRTVNVRAWMLDPESAAAFPNEDDLTLLAVGIHRRRLAEFRADIEGGYARMVASLPDAPDLREAERVSKLIGKLEMPNVMRPAARPGLAFVGDAGLATDPLFGVGLAWAFQSAEWLADEAAPALLGDGDLDAALRRYQRKLAWRLVPHHLVIAEYSSGRKLLPWERLTFRAAVTDPVVSRTMEEVISRRRSPLRILAPRFAAHVLASSLSRYLSTTRSTTGESRPTASRG